MRKGFYFIEQVIKNIRKDQFKKLFAPIWSRKDAEQFKNKKLPSDIDEIQLFEILRNIKERKELRYNITSNLSEFEKEYHVVHRFYELAIYGSSFFEKDYQPLLQEEHIYNWRSKFKSNKALIELLDKVF